MLRALVQNIDHFEQAVRHSDRVGIKHQLLQPFIKIQASLTRPGQVRAAEVGVAYVARKISLLRGNVGRRVITCWRRQVLRTRLA